VTQNEPETVSFINKESFPQIFTTISVEHRHNFFIVLHTNVGQNWWDLCPARDLCIINQNSTNKTLATLLLCFGLICFTSAFLFVSK